MSDDITTYGCNLVDKADGYYYPRNETYQSVAEFIMPNLRFPVAKAFGLTDQ